MFTLVAHPRGRCPSSDFPLVTVGDEIGRQNLPVSLSWPQHRVAVLIGEEPGADELQELRADGWTLAAPTVEAIRSVMDSTTPTEDTTNSKAEATTEGRAG